jgi:hypothetical protein
MHDITPWVFTTKLRLTLTWSFTLAATAIIVLFYKYFIVFRQDGFNGLWDQRQS